MIWTKVKRIFRSGFINFWRNGYVSLASVVVMVVTLFVLSSIIFGSGMLSSVLQNIKDKVDVNVYFVNSATESDVVTIQKQLEALPEVREVTYVSREQALEAFRLRHENDERTLRALDELDDNPLGAVLNVKANETSEYESIAAYLESEQETSGATVIEKVTYYQNKEAIDSLTNIIDAGKKLGAVITIIFVLISILITFNTIRLAIYISRDEISVMRLVGASNMYIRGPFIVGGIMYGVLAAVITLVGLYPLTYALGDTTNRLFGGISVFNYYLANLGQMFAIIVLAGALIGAVSSYLAVRKYLSK